jgi:hypothetical protein
LTTTVIGCEVTEQPVASVVVTVYDIVPLGLSVIIRVVAPPGDHW